MGTKNMVRSLKDNITMETIQLMLPCLKGLEDQKNTMGKTFQMRVDLLDNTLFSNKSLQQGLKLRTRKDSEVYLVHLGPNQVSRVAVLQVLYNQELSLQLQEDLHMELQEVEAVYSVRQVPQVELAVLLVDLDQ